MKDEKLEKAVADKTRAYSKFPESFAEVSKGYKEKYSEHSWIRQLVRETTGLAPGDGRAYTNARRKIERWESGTNNFDKARKASKAEIAEAGKTLPPTQIGVPPGGLSFTISGSQKADKHGGTRDREFTIKMSHSEAAQFVADPSYEELYNDYFDGAADLFLDSDYALEGVTIS